MTDPQQLPPSPPSDLSPLSRSLNWLKRPSTLITGGVLLAFGTGVYVLGQQLVYRQGSPFLETELSHFLQRPIQIGEIEQVSFNQIRLGTSTLPPTPQDPTTIQIQGLELAINPLLWLVGKPIEIQADLIRPTVKLSQNKKGEWSGLTLPQGKGKFELPADVDIQLRIKEAQISLTPYGARKPLLLAVDGRGRYRYSRQKSQQTVNYDLKLALQGNRIAAKGETILETGKSQAALIIEKLNLPEIAQLIPQAPLQVSQGKLNGKLQIDLPSFKEYHKTRTLGNLALENLQAKFDALKVPLIANFQIGLQGQTMVINQGEITLGKLITRLQGQIDWQKGYNLALQTNVIEIQDLVKTLSVSLPIAAQGKLKAQFKLQGPLENPLLLGRVENLNPLTLDKIKIQSFQTQLRGNLDRLSFQKIRFQPQVGGEILAKGDIQLGILKNWQKKRGINWQTMPLSLQFSSQLSTEKLLRSYQTIPADLRLSDLTVQGQVTGTLAQPIAQLQWQGQRPFQVNQVAINAQGKAQLAGTRLAIQNRLWTNNGGVIQVQGKGDLKGDRWQTRLQAQQFVLTPWVEWFCGRSPCPPHLKNQPLSLQSVNLELRGQFSHFAPETLQGGGEIKVRVSQQPLTAQIKLRQGFFTSSAQFGQIALNPFLPNLPKTVQLQRGHITLAGQIQPHWQVAWSGLSGRSDLRLAVEKGRLRFQGEITQGQLTAIAAVKHLNLQPIFPKITLPTQINRGKVTLIASLADLVQPQPNLQHLQAIADLQLNVAGGQVQSQSYLNRQQWQSNLQANNLNFNHLLLATNLSTKVKQQIPILSPLNGKLKLTGKINNLGGLNKLESFQSLPITVQSAAFNAGKQSLEFQGNLVIAQLFQNPQFTQVNLQVKSQADLAILPLNAIISSLSLPDYLRPQSAQIAGIASFQGLVRWGLVRDVGDQWVQGKVALQNFVINQERFEPLLNGSLHFSNKQGLAIDLKGESDRLALNLDSCRASNCSFAYLPNRLIIAHTYQTENPLIASGEKIGQIFRLNIAQFPLALLNLQPGKLQQIPGVLKGNLQAQLDLDLQNQKAQGSLKLHQPSLGYLSADAIAANFDYDNNLLQLQNAILQLQQSRYALEGSLNFNTQAVRGNLQIAKGRVQDLLTALQIFDLESLRSRFQPQPQTLAKTLAPKSVGDAQAPLDKQVNILYQIDQTIRQLAEKYEQGGVPNELRIDGLFNAKIGLEGTLADPQVNIALSGEHWSWYPQPAFANIIAPLGLVINDTRFLPIHQVALQASWKKGVLTVQPSQITIKDSHIALQGNFSQEQNAAIWRIDNLALDTLGIFVKLPEELSGNFNAQGSITGNLNNPQLRGEFNFTDFAVNARLLAQPIAGNFSYSDNFLQVIADNNSPLFFYAKIPYAWNEEAKLVQKQRQENQFDLRLRLKKDALTLIGALTQDQLVWLSGEGEVNLAAQGRLDLSQGLRLSEFQARGNIKLQEVLLKSAILPNPIQITGDIDLDNQSLQVKYLEGIFAQSKLAVTGMLPLFRPQDNIDNPLTLTVEKAKLDIANLYEGDLEGLLTVKGTAFSPKISGDIRLANGQVFVPQAPSAQEQTSPIFSQNPWFKPRKSQSLLTPQLENLRVTLDNLFVKQVPLYDFAFGGALTLNGPLTDLNRLQPQGAIALSRGRISFLDTRFLLERRYKNQITFRPSQGLLNPDIDIKMRTIVSELPQSKRLRSAESNEIPDDTLNQVQRIDINLNIYGSLHKLVPNLNQAQVDACTRERQFRPFRETQNISDWRMKRVANCLQVLAAQGITDQQLLSNPAIRLTSNPARSQGQIVRLLGEQFVVLADALQGKNSGQLLQYGITQLAIPMIFQGTVYDVETAISNTLGTTDFRVVPFLEAIYQVEKKGFVRLSYDYSFNEVKVRYEKQF